MNPAAVEKPKLYNKLTEIGEIPEEWKVVRLGDACNQRNEIIQPSGKGEYKFVGLEHINSGEIGIHAYQLDTDVKSSKFRFHRGDILYGKLRPYLDKAVITDFDGICSTDLLVLTTVDNKTSAEFLIYLIHSNQFIRNSISATSGTNHPRTSWKEISKFKFGLPPLPEQRRIAEVLGTVDSAIQKVGGAIERTERLKKGLMQRLLTRGIGHERFKESEVGRVPEEWEVVRLGDESITEIRGNKTVNNFERVAFIPMEFVPDSDIFVKYENRPMKDVKSFTYCERGDLLLAKITPSLENGKQGIVPDNIPNGFALATTEVFPISCKGIDRLFLFYVLKFPKFRNKIISSMIGTTGRQRASKDSVEKLQIPLPPLPEQRRIAEMMSAADRKLGLERRRKDKLERVKKGLMKELLTGRKRVKSNNFIFLFIQ